MNASDGLATHKVSSLGVMFGKGSIVKKKKKSKPLSLEWLGHWGGLGRTRACSSAGWVWAYLKIFGSIPVPVEQQHIV